MRLEIKQVKDDKLPFLIKDWLLANPNGRFSFLTSIDGSQLACLLLHSDKPELWIVDVVGDTYKSMTTSFPACHWFERAIWDLFQLKPDGHPRLKHLLLQEQYAVNEAPLRLSPVKKMPEGELRQYDFLEVKGEGVYEIPVGPIHAGIIEPGHFRFSCFGENILNLEIRLGYLHRGVEKRLTEVPWTKCHFVAEAVASDTAVANALAHAVALESILEIESPPLASSLRTIALEVERLAMHIIDVGGIAADIGFLGISSSMGRLRGKALALGQKLSGNRFMRGFVVPGGVLCLRSQAIAEMSRQVQSLKEELAPVLTLLMENQVAIERMLNIGVVSRGLVEDFGVVGVAARASGVAYDARQHFKHGLYPNEAPPIVVQSGGDILSRTKVRVGEIATSISVIESVLNALPSGEFQTNLGDKLPADKVGLGVVEAFRGELIHLLFTDSKGQIKRYAIKDPSANNWTALSIAIRNNLIADFPLCNKSFSLSYGGNDL